MECLIRYSLTQFLPFLPRQSHSGVWLCYVQFRSYGRLQPILCLASILYVLIPNVELLVRFADNFRCTVVYCITLAWEFRRHR